MYISALSYFSDSVIVAISFGLLYALMRLVWHCTRKKKHEHNKEEEKRIRFFIGASHFFLGSSFFWHSFILLLLLAKASRAYRNCLGVFIVLVLNQLTLSQLIFGLDAVSKKCANERIIIETKKSIDAEQMLQYKHNKSDCIRHQP